VEKKTHFGRAGEFAAMSEFLLRGYNVAVPTVDVGDDAFVIDDRLSTTWRVQVKTGDGVAAIKGDAQTARYALSRTQLRAEKVTMLFFMFMLRWQDRWRYILIPREDLADFRDDAVAAQLVGKKRGRRSLSDDEATSDRLTMSITWTASDAVSWGKSLSNYMDKWPSQLPPITDGPGATSRAPSR